MLDGQKAMIAAKERGTIVIKRAQFYSDSTPYMVCKAEYLRYSIRYSHIYIYILIQVVFTCKETHKGYVQIHKCLVSYCKLASRPP